MTPATIRFVWLFLAVVLAGCGAGRVVTVQHDSGPPPGSIDVTNVPNAVPRVEAKSRYGNPESYVVFGKRYAVLDKSEGFIQRGIASWYGEKFHGRRTSSGETYDMYAMTAAHKNLPLPTYVQVRNLQNNKSIIVRVNDRGPFHENRIIDLSYTAAAKLDIIKDGTGLVEIRAIAPSQDESATQLIRTGVPDAEVRSFFIQVGAFSEYDNALSLKQRLYSLSNSIRIAEARLSSNTVYRVQIGPVESIDTADELVAGLEQYGVQEHRIVLDD